jgi:hypothetical protein
MSGTAVTPIDLKSGSHRDPGVGMCFNEAASYLAGEKHSDSPQCVSPVIRRFGMALNDRLDDTRRQLLRPYVYRSLGTAGDGRDEERRQMCAEWLIENLPPIYERAGLTEAAEKIRGFSGNLAVENVQRVLREVRNEAYEARRSAFSKLRATVKAKYLEERARREAPSADAAADAAAVVDADAAADAAAAAVAAAVADADAAAAAVVDAVADADAAAVAVAVAAADAAAAAAADAAADAAAAAAAEIKYGTTEYWKFRDKVYAVAYKAAKVKADEIYGEMSDERLASALELFSRMLPAAPLIVPAVENAEALCAA